MNYLLCYLAIGALFTAVVLLRTPYSNDFDQLALTATGGTDVSEKILAVFLVPLLFCLFVVLAWPLAMYWKVQAMRTDRERRAKEGDAPQPKFEEPEVHYFHPRINGKIVSNEEWQAARSQRMDTEAEGIANSVIKKAMNSAISAAAKACGGERPRPEQLAARLAAMPSRQATKAGPKLKPAAKRPRRKLASLAASSA